MEPQVFYMTSTFWTPTINVQLARNHLLKSHIGFENVLLLSHYYLYLMIDRLWLHVMVVLTVMLRLTGLHTFSYSDCTGSLIQTQLLPCVLQMQPGEILLVKPIKCESGTQTDLHPVETKIVKSYEWNEWGLRRKAVKRVSHSSFEAFQWGIIFTI